MLKEHEAKQALRSVSHIKQSRESKEEYDNKTYPYIELFPDLKKMISENLHKLTGLLHRKTFQN